MKSNQYKSPNQLVLVRYCDVTMEHTPNTGGGGRLGRLRGGVGSPVNGLGAAGADPFGGKPLGRPLRLEGKSLRVRFGKLGWIKQHAWSSKSARVSGAPGMVPIQPVWSKQAGPTPSQQDRRRSNTRPTLCVTRVWTISRRETKNCMQWILVAFHIGNRTTLNILPCSILRVDYSFYVPKPQNYCMFQLVLNSEISRTTVSKPVKKV